MRIHPRFRPVLSLAVVLLLHAAVSLLHAQAPSIQNADVVVRPPASDLKPVIDTLVRDASTPAWIAYSVPLIPGDSSMCCFHGDGDNGCCRGCSLEDNGANFSRTRGSQTVQLEASRSLLVLARAEVGRLDKVQAYSSDCPLDAGGRRVYWLNGVDARQSVDYLAGLVRGSDWSEKQEKRIANGALAAIAHHAGTAADSAMASFLAAGSARGLRKQEPFGRVTLAARPVSNRFARWSATTTTRSSAKTPCSPSASAAKMRRSMS